MEPMLEQFSSAFEAVPAAVLVVDETGIIVLANADVNALFGYETGELVGQPIEVLVPDDVRAGHPELREAYQALPHRRTMGSGRDLFGVTKSGRLIPVEIGLNSVQSSEGRYSVASVLDMSATVAEQERTRRAIDATGSAMIMVDGTGRIVLTNNAAYEMFQAGSGDLLGASIEQLIPERFRRRHVVYRTSYSAEPSIRNMGLGRDLFGLRPDGSEFPIEIGLTPIDHDGERVIMATVIDLTERVRSEQEIVRQNEDLTRLNDELTQFAYSASHDLKAPLTTLDGILTCLNEDIDDGNLDEATINANRAKDLARRLADLIESTLGLAQSESYDEDDYEPVDLSDLVEKTRTSLAALLESNGVELRNEVPVGCVPLTQQIRLRQIMENLIGNSAKYSDAAKSDRYVEVSTEIESEGIRIIVTDNGLGIPSDSHDHVFKRFRRFGNHDVEGSGVGLALVKQHVDRLNGEITFTSTTGGTSFEIILPSDNDSETVLSVCEPQVSKGVEVTS